MPYIKQEARDCLKHGEYPRNAGELNYIISTECAKYIKDLGVSYQILNEVIGVLECAKLELYRRYCVPYEDIKIKENGDI